MERRRSWHFFLRNRERTPDVRHQMLPTVISAKRSVPHLHLPVGTTTNPVITDTEFKNSMASLAFSIAVVTARTSNEEIGRTITSFMPLSLLPPRVMISIDVRSRLIDLIGSSQSFSISFLSDKHRDVGDAFAGKWSQVDRFALGDWDVWPSGNRKLVDAVLSMDCDLTASIDAGDHMLFIGTIIDCDQAWQLDRLLWIERSYRVLKSEMDTTADASER